MSSTSLTNAEFDDASLDYEHTLQLSSEYRLAWTVRGVYPTGEISIMIQARTTGWVGFGLMADDTSNGMVDTDIIIGAIV